MAKRNVELEEYLKANPPNSENVKGYNVAVAKKFGVAPETVSRALSRLKDEKPRTFEEQLLADRRMLALRSENELLARKCKELLKDANAQEKILEMNRLTIQALPPVETAKLPKPKSGQSVESAVLVGSCWHIGELINKDEMGGYNEYNFDIFCRRLQHLVRTTISFTTENMSTHVFDELHILLTGDMVSGIIHDELREHNELNIVEQASIGALVAAQAIQQLARAFPKVIVTCVVGNHGRVTEKKYFKNKQTVNWDFVFYNNLALLLKNQANVSFNIPLSWWAGISIKGHNFLVMHGDLIKSWGGIPFYGINRMVAKWIEIKAAHGEFFEYFIASHFHNWAGIQTAAGENVLNASMKGGDEYATGLGLFSEPWQLLFGVHDKFRKTWEIKINTKYGDTVPHKYKYNRSLPLASQAKVI